MKKRVVVTGMGVVSPNGNTLEAFWQSLLAGKSGAGRITRFDPEPFPTQIAAEVKDFNPELYLEKKEARRMDLSEQYAVAASDMALVDAGLKDGRLDPDRIGVVIGSGIGGISTFERQHSLMEETGGPAKVSPFFIPMMIIDMCAGLVSIRYGFRGPNYATVSACASSAHAIADAFRIIQRDEADVMVTGGAEATITRTALAGFCQAKALSVRNDEPERASRPFDAERDGFVMGEGAAILVLESLDHARARGVRIYAELLGAGMSGDAHHMTAPHPEGLGARRAMAMALRDAGLAPEQIDYVNTHGTATILGDTAETRAIKEVLGPRAYEIPCNSTKSMTGHLLGAAGALEVAACVLSLRDSVVHPTINIDTPDPECDLDYVREGKRAVTIRHALSNSFGFGGHNVSLVVGTVNGSA
ncbi:MAG TPA: beta-ketoacyl-ACP synthase II [candidate division Zixibacteria bacterium]|nr:beta-ketoacyl-ACP synthase II [candidate division Zixibacteria bacterium]MDD4918798.1 beta-ketoacyl-ACP synthase II [candidate division Zixibacteria bacterium]HOD65972.1 beta-ketoacyl-ACP synthase II [candidate division Zixibacteria bacterium]HOZ07334.1 beta-ketoacyl-ACP synthase II [candidate division Zixibacteria bacterium]HPC10960.1 beta-ketoacyl-ACP synthase II [candidate division Zixibacteria bacterium]